MLTIERRYKVKQIFSLQVDAQ
uniref:Uncharacterized protein n=1 Tax=Rhizophora mucronata TaxID=61149 RepID=A0A2P2R0C9_RHIMU